MFFHRANSSLENHTHIDMLAFDEEVKNWEWVWVNSHEKYPVHTSGDPVQVAKSMYEKYRERVEEIYKDIKTA